MFEYLKTMFRRDEYRELFILFYPTVQFSMTSFGHYSKICRLLDIMTPGIR
jgi:hypothetical protein